MSRSFLVVADTTSLKTVLTNCLSPGPAVHRAVPLFVHRWNAHRAERLFVSTLITIQTLVQRCGIEPIILHPFATFIPVLGLHHVVLDAEFLQPTLQWNPNAPAS